jgi:succinate dehydrogenase hydrophobic anchor subunit
VGGGGGGGGGGGARGGGGVCTTPPPPPARAADLLGSLPASTVREAFHKTSYLLAAGVPAAFLLGNPVDTMVDTALSVALPLHFHIGMRSVLVDYVHDATNLRLASIALAAATVATAVGLLVFTYADVGLTGAVKTLFVELTDDGETVVTSAPSAGGKLH